MKKLHTLRSQFRREVKTVKASQRSGVGTDVVYIPKLWCYNSLSFLGDGDILRDSTSTLDEVPTQATDRVLVAQPPVINIKRPSPPDHVHPTTGLHHRGGPWFLPAILSLSSPTNLANSSPFCTVGKRVTPSTSKPPEDTRCQSDPTPSPIDGSLLR
ncbi:hypothetical protein Pcinc_015047 [Petrolisthes cinctipes]|uniref:Uncharacterized protein n=1 Tax=Petrolisthes cinctipes TaxID=88211 RepID=A0AAE1FVN8_PETCI|nr:hypothetical protein Pcinc_015047 [Petrolisthes cinctipes]